MEKQKLAEMVMQKMKQKRELQEKNRPHYQVLRLQATFSRQLNDNLKDQIAALEALASQQRSRLKQLQSHLNQIDNTGKKQLPRIIVLPQFIASEHIQVDTKQFYRKSSNSFLRTDILRNKGYDESMEKQKKIINHLGLIRELQNIVRKNQDEDRKILNDKRIKVLKQDLRLRSIRQEQRNIKKQIEQERQDNKQLLKQYELKKLNLQSRKDRLKYVIEQIEFYKKEIERNYNPITYREHLKNVFAGQIKNQIMRGNLIEATKKVENVDKQTKIFQKHLQKNSSLVVLGRTSDSPSTKLGKIQKRLSAEKRRNSFVIGQSIGKQTKSQRSLSHHDLPKDKLKLDFSNIVQSSGKTSIRTTDRSSHKRQFSSLSKTLF